jgi:hypothetical protein
MVITLGPELEAALKEVAYRHGISPETLALNTLRDGFLPPARTDESRDDWERQLRQIGINCGVSLPDEALSSEGLYED